MLVRAAAIIGGLLLVTGIAAAQMLASQPTSLKLSDLVDPAAQHDPAAPSNRSIVRRHPAEAAAAGVPTCPWDCEAVPDKQIGINDFLAVLAQWGTIGSSCDFDGGGVGINDFLAILANWGPCPAPVNDECDGRIIIDRLDSGGTLTEHFDMYGATPSPDPSQCLPPGDQAKDIWYCLTNVTMEKKIVTLTGSVDLLAEVTAGCDCANPGPLVTCGRLVAAAPTSFTMQAGEQVCIRLLNDLNLANDAIKGDLIITNEPPPSEKCYDQQPDQVQGFFSDIDCDICVAKGGSPQQVVAEQLILFTPEIIDELRFWGGYFPGDAGGGNPLPDNFTVKFRLNDDSTGIDLPGSVVRKLQIGPATTRVATGVIIFGVREFEYTIDLQPNQDLQPGFYWVEIYNDTANDPTNDDWLWETGALDAVNGLPNFAFSFDPPNVLPKGWTTSRGNLSLNITCKPDDGNPPHDIEPCPPPDCPPGDDPIWCVYDIINVQGDPVICEKRGIFPGGLICVTPCPFPGDLVDCDPDGTGIVTFRTVDNGCLFDAVPNNGCMPCPPGAIQWRRIN